MCAAVNNTYFIETHVIQIVIITNDSRDRYCTRRFNKLNGSQVSPKAY